MFPKVKSIERSFQYIRFFTLVVIVASLSLCGFSLYKSFLLANTTQNRIYVLVNGKVLEAVSSDKKENIPVEARDHVKMFHYYFFTLDPDEKIIKTNITRALYLADGSAKQQYVNLKEQGYYASIISGNISQEIEVDSTAVNTSTYPYYFRCYASQRIIRSSSIVTRSLVTEGYLRNTGRSDNNSHGFLIERWAIIENRDLNITNR
ncbi:conjugative transposon protein TraK [Paraflavitalea sp. CAU 1676]|uniref:conjugative transposon protein TraK n=1 Tax=Paraflavitalea sp. CAU 1676 TaxID=3032598 RepID=UPI0023DBD4D9|nr:conjugative transposon protein TraK [Paraflavitalea sp. CAU 1676]MDF2188719.1 conjugative transposon protein TraK [Paraflavitalea sp. CAU 1676]